jgi:hypothetical protein
MKLSQKILLTVGLLIITSSALYLVSNRNDITKTEDIKNDVSLTSDYDEFNELSQKAIHLEKIQTKLNVKPNGIDVCDQLAPVKNCLFLKLNTEYLNSNQESSIYFIKKPIENIFYKYQQVGDMDLVMQYHNHGWEFPRIAYLKNATIGISKMETNKYYVYKQSFADGGYASNAYMIDTDISNFPYWIGVELSSNIDSLDKDRIDDDFIKTIEIERL